MKDERPDADDPLWALAQALDVDPSPGFAARVREGVDADRAARRRTWRYAMAAAVPLLAALIVWVAQVPGDGQPAVSSPGAAEAGASVAGGRMPGADVVGAAPPTVASERPAAGATHAHGEEAQRRARVERTRSQRFATAPVIVPPGQLEGVQRLARAAAAGRVRMGPQLAMWAANVDPEVAPLAAPDPLRVPPIEIDPLTE
jgi:hypothetical protein